jgi:hypothetical protein
LSEERQTKAGMLWKKRGVPVYDRNPSIPAEGEASRTRKRQIGHEAKGLVIDDGSGAIIGRGTAIAYELEEVDDERFVKLFLAGLRQATGLSKAGLSIFEVVYHQIQERPNIDEVKLSLYGAKQDVKTITERTYQRGLRELLDRQFLFRSPAEGVFFVNIRYMFNGDRLAFVKAYHRKGSKPPSAQLTLGLDETKP